MDKYFLVHPNDLVIAGAKAGHEAERVYASARNLHPIPPTWGELTATDRDVLIERAACVAPGLRGAFQRPASGVFGIAAKGVIDALTVPSPEAETQPEGLYSASDYNPRRRPDGFEVGYYVEIGGPPYRSWTTPPGGEWTVFARRDGGFELLVREMKPGQESTA